MVSIKSAFILLARGLRVASLSLLIFTGCTNDASNNFPVTQGMDYSDYVDKMFFDCLDRQYNNQEIIENNEKVDVKYVKQISRFIQYNIKYEKDVEDYWQSASETLNRMAGDCDDKALYAYFSFREKRFDDRCIGLALVLINKCDPFSLHLAATVVVDEEQFVLSGGDVISINEYISTEKELLLEFSIMDYI